MAASEALVRAGPALKAVGLSDLQQGLQHERRLCLGSSPSPGQRWEQEEEWPRKARARNVWPLILVKVSAPGTGRGVRGGLVASEHPSTELAWAVLTAPLPRVPSWLLTPG